MGLRAISRKVYVAAQRIKYVNRNFVKDKGLLDRGLNKVLGFENQVQRLAFLRGHYVDLGMTVSREVRTHSPLGYRYIQPQIWNSISFPKSISDRIARLSKRIDQLAKGKMTHIEDEEVGPFRATAIIKPRREWMNVASWYLTNS
jgi:hypothetical protein